MKFEDNSRFYFMKCNAFFLAMTCLVIDMKALAIPITINEEKYVDYSQNTSDRGTEVGTNNNYGKLTVATDQGVWETSLLRVGMNGGSGEVNVINGGRLIINNNATNYTYYFGIGGSRESTGQDGSINSVGILNISGAGSEVIVDPGFGSAASVGNKGAVGYINITDGGKLVLNGDLEIGSDGGATTQGFITVKGKNSEAIVGDRFWVGVYSKGNALFAEGAKLTVNGSGTNAMVIGEQATNGLMVITGENTTATIANGGVVVGSSGEGTLIVSDKAELSVAKDIVIGATRNGIGELAIGSRKGEQATKAGTINANSIHFGNGTGTLVFNHTSEDFVLNAPISGAGTVEVLSGTTTLTGANTYTGTTTIENGAFLQAGATNTFSSNSIYSINSGGAMNLKGYNQTIPTLTNAGTTDLTGSVAGTALTITGNYAGQNGHLVMGTVLGDDTSPTDQLVIQGNATGTTHVTVKNLGGYGAKTIEGIKIIDVQGVSDSNAFVQNGRIVAGAYDYSLVKGSATGQDEQSWYLTSVYDPTLIGDSGSGSISMIRPEAMAYLSNLALANNMFTLKLHDRQVERAYIDPITGKTKTTTLWIRHNYGHNEFNDTTGTLNTKSNRNIFQIGGDIAQWTTNDNNRLHLGIMAGYGSANGRSKSKVTNYSARNELKGYSVGLYGTWYENAVDKTGLYVDSWVLWNKFTAKVNGQELAEEKYHLKGITGSTEVGYTINAGKLREDYELWIQPQAQVTWQGIKADKHIEQNGSLVTANRDNIQTRLGTRLLLVPRQAADISTFSVTPFVEGNWLHNSRNYGIDMNKVSINEAGTKNIAEIKAGIEGNINQNTKFLLNAGYQFGHDSYKDTTTTIGIEYTF